MSLHRVFSQTITQNKTKSTSLHTENFISERDDNHTDLIKMMKNYLHFYFVPRYTESFILFRRLFPRSSALDFRIERFFCSTSLKNLRLFKNIKNFLTLQNKTPTSPK